MTVITPPILNPGQVVETSISDGEVTNIKIANPQITIGTHVVPLGSRLLLDTDDVSEAGNLYYSDARVDSRLSSGSVGNIDVSGMVITSGGIAQGSGPLTITGDPASYTLIDSALSYIGTLAGGYATFTNGDLVVGDISASTGHVGNLTVQTLATTYPTFSISSGGTFDINGGGSNGNITLTPGGSGYAHINSLTTYVGSFSDYTTIAGSSITGNLTGNVTGNVQGNTSGNVETSSITSPTGANTNITAAGIVSLTSNTSYAAIAAANVYISDGAGSGMLFSGTTMSTFSGQNITVGRPIDLNNQTADPASPTAGTMYFNSTSGKFRGYNGTAWVDLG